MVETGWKGLNGNAIKWEGDFYANKFYGDGSGMTNLPAGTESDPIFVALSASLGYLPTTLSGSLPYLPTTLSGSLPYLPTSLSASLTYLSGAGLLAKGQYTFSGGAASIVGTSGTGALWVRDTTGLGGQIDFGNNTAAIGISRDGVVSGYDYDGAFVFKQKGTNPDGPVEFLFIEEAGDWRFALPAAATGRGTYNPRSMIIAGPSPNNASAVSGATWGFDKLAMDTSGTGADLGVQHDIQVLGTSWLSGNIISNSTISGAAIKGEWSGSAVGLTRGGTASNLTAVNGGVVYSTATSLAITAAGSAGQVLVSQGANPPLWVNSGGATATNSFMISGNADNDTQSITASVLIACHGAIRRASSPTAYTHFRVVPAGTWSNLWVGVANNDRDTGTCVYNLRDDGVNTSISASIAAGATGAFTCDTATASVAANSLLNAQAIVAGGSSGQYNINNVSSYYTAT